MLTKACSHAYFELLLRERLFSHCQPKLTHTRLQVAMLAGSWRNANKMRTRRLLASLAVLVVLGMLFCAGASQSCMCGAVADNTHSDVSLHPNARLCNAITPRCTPWARHPTQTQPKNPNTHGFKALGMRNPTA